MMHVAIDLSMVLDRLGRSAEVESLRDAAEKTLTSTPRLGLFGYGLADVEILALRGEEKAALDQFEAAIDTNFGHLWRFQTIHNRNLDSLKDNPRYASLLHELELKVSARSGLR